IMRGGGGGICEEEEGCGGCGAADNDILGDDRVGCRINDGDEVGVFMYEEESSAIRGDGALMRGGAHGDRSGGCLRDRIDNRNGIVVLVGNIGLTPIR